MKKINTDLAPKSIGPYSQAIQVDSGFLFTSGQLGMNPKTNELVDGIINQTKQALENAHQILKEAGYKKEDVVKTLVLLKDIKDFQQMNGEYEKFFQDHKPARSAFQVAALPKDGLVEIEIIAYKK